MERELKAVSEQRYKNAQDRDQQGQMLLERTPEKNAAHGGTGYQGRRHPVQTDPELD